VAVVKKLTVLSRVYCHLCDDLIAALQAFLPTQGGDAPAVEIIDIDTRPDLEDAWGDKVPVLLAGNVGSAQEQEICHYFFDSAQLEAHLVQTRNHVTAA
jgi:hypothetical protein